MNYKILALVIYTVTFCFDMFIKYLSYRSKDNPIPENVRDLYDAESYAKWQSYHKKKCFLGIISQIVTYVVFFCLFLFDVFALAEKIYNVYLYHAMPIALAVTVNHLINAVFSYIYTMNVEEKYGFNRMKLKTFIADRIKSYAIMMLFSVSLAVTVGVIYEEFGDYVLLIMSGFFAVFMFIGTASTPFTSRIYNKFTTLEEGELRTKLTALLEKNGYRVRRIKVMDASRRSTKMNAYFAGVGRTKTIVLYDTLIEAMTPDEIVAIFAHEMGHGMHKDTLKMGVIGLLNAAVLVGLAWMTVRTWPIYPPFGFEYINYGFAMVLVTMVEFPLIAPLFSMLMGAVSRRHEYRADEVAAKEGYGRELITALKKISKGSLSDLAPSKIEIALSYSHPTLSQRITAIENQIQNN